MLVDGDGSDLTADGEWDTAGSESAAAVGDDADRAIRSVNGLVLPRYSCTAGAEQPGRPVG